MTKKEALRQTEQERVLMSLGFTSGEAEQLRRISMTLHRWHELECGTDSACLVRGKWNTETQTFDYDDAGRPHFEYAGGSGRSRYSPITDREKGARKRLAEIIGQRNGRPAIINGHLNAAPAGPVRAYIQGDPRGAALYILRPDDVPAGGSDDSYYNRGICVW